MLDVRPPATKIIESPVICFLPSAILSYLAIHFSAMLMSLKSAMHNLSFIYWVAFQGQEFLSFLLPFTLQPDPVLSVIGEKYPAGRIDTKKSFSLILLNLSSENIWNIFSSLQYNLQYNLIWHITCWQVYSLIFVCCVLLH